jgi:hypothetical protein
MVTGGKGSERLPMSDPYLGAAPTLSALDHRLGLIVCRRWVRWVLDRAVFCAESQGAKGSEPLPQNDPFPDAAPTRSALDSRPGLIVCRRWVRRILNHTILDCAGSHHGHWGEGKRTTTH